MVGVWAAKTPVQRGSRPCVLGVGGVILQAPSGCVPGTQGPSHVGTCALTHLSPLNPELWELGHIACAFTCTPGAAKSRWW